MRIEALVVERVVDLRLIPLELMLAKEDKLLRLRPNRCPCSLALIHDLRPIVSLALFLCFEGIVEAKVKGHR